MNRGQINAAKAANAATANIEEDRSKDRRGPEQRSPPSPAPDSTRGGDPNPNVRPAGSRHGTARDAATAGPVLPRRRRTEPGTRSLPPARASRPGNPAPTTESRRHRTPPPPSRSRRRTTSRDPTRRPSRSHDRRRPIDPDTRPWRTRATAPNGRTTLTRTPAARGGGAGNEHLEHERRQLDRQQLRRPGDLDMTRRPPAARGTARR